MIEGSFDISEVDVHLCRGCAIAAPESLASCRCRCRRTRTVCVGPRESVGGTGGVGTGKTHLATTNGDSYRLKAAQRNQTAHARQKKTR